MLFHCSPPFWFSPGTALPLSPGSFFLMLVTLQPLPGLVTCCTSTLWEAFREKWRRRRSFSFKLTFCGFLCPSFIYKIKKEYMPLQIWIFFSLQCGTGHANTSLTSLQFKTHICMPLGYRQAYGCRIYRWPLQLKIKNSALACIQSVHLCCWQRCPLINTAGTDLANKHF